MAETVIQQFQQSLQRTKNVNTDLLTNGYSVIDNVFDREILLALQDEISMLHDSCKLELSPNSVQGMNGENFILTKPAILEWSLVLRNEKVAGDATMSMVPCLNAFWEFREQVLSTLQSNCKILSTLTSLDQLKVAVIGPGGAFAVHTDTSNTTGRTLSITIYLNEEYCQETDGGELRVYPFPHAPVDIAPLFGRLVLFSSCNLFHRVLPSHAERRFCISFMFYGTDSNFPQAPLLSDFDAVLAARLFDERRVLTPLIYQLDFERSIGEAFGGVEFDVRVRSAVDRFSNTCQEGRRRLDPTIREALERLPLLLPPIHQSTVV